MCLDQCAWVQPTRVTTIVARHADVDELTVIFAHVGTLVASILEQ
jgi:hypothetical protein